VLSSIATKIPERHRNSDGRGELSGPDYLNTRGRNVGENGILTRTSRSFIGDPAKRLTTVVDLISKPDFLAMNEPGQ
jgi:hypothetical protein